jgi:GrpB-like predicted nucleotidyltransferase (UPF0157 family)
MRTIVVVDYDPVWPDWFEQLRGGVWPVVHDVALAVEHVGSTSVPGLAAKPVIDMSVVVPSEAAVPLAIARLATIGYLHRGNRGVEGREAFDGPPDGPAHNLYVCPTGSLGLVNQLAVRDYLRKQPETARAYGDLKKRLAAKFPDDIDSYVRGKTDLVLDLLGRAGLSATQLDAIERANRAP